MRRLVWFTLGFAAACFVGTYLAPGLWALLGAACAGFLAGGLAVRRYRGNVAAVAALCSLGLAVGLLWFCLYDGVFLQSAKEADGKTMPLELRILEYPVETDSGYSVEGAVSLNGRAYRTRLYFQEIEGVPEPGDRIRATVQLRLTTHGGSREPTYHRSAGIFLLAYARDSVTLLEGARSFWDFPVAFGRKVSRQLDAVFPEDAAGFAKALLLGDRGGLSYARQNEMSLAGISHVAAVSGMHLSILLAGLFFLTRRHRVFSAVLGIPAAVFFAAMAGFTPSVSRAAVMLSLSLLARLIHREYDSPSALAFAALLLLLANPMTAASAGFQLSVGAVAGILCFSGRLYAWMMKKEKKSGKSRRIKMKRALAGSLAVSLGASVFTAPLTAWTFGVVSLLSPLTNLLTLWAVSLAFYCEIAACVLYAFLQPAAMAAGWCGTQLIRLIIAVSGCLGRLPGAGVFPEENVYLWAWVWFALALLGVFLAGRCRGKRIFALGLTGCLLLSIFLGFLEPGGEQFRVTVLDVGQGQCVLLQTEGKTYVVDCGGSEGEGAGEKAARHLLSQGKTQIEGLILTHFDEDHVSGAAQLMRRIQVDRLYMPRQPEHEDCAALAEMAGERAFFVEEDVCISLEQAQMWIFAPLSRTSSNESGLSVLFTAGECDTLITGDMSRNLERRLIASHHLPDIEILVAGHHGSKSSTGLELLQALRPEAVAVSVGQNAYGHPSPEMLDRAVRAGCRIFRTDQSGTLVFRG